MSGVGALDGDIRFCLVLPCEALSVPVMRRVLGGTLLGFGADEDCVADILLAATEACTNVLKHDARASEYEVSASVGKDDCLLEIANGASLDGKTARRLNGSPFRAGQPFRNVPPFRSVPPFRNGLRLRPWRGPARGDTEQDLAQISESGRGLTIMRACVDDLSLRGTASRGTVVSMRKQITWAPAGAGRHAAPGGSGGSEAAPAA